MKQHARRFVAETKTDILTACDLKKVLESNGGVKGCRVSVVEMPQRSSQIDTNVKIKGISQIHNFRYEEGGIRFWKAFDIGKGKRVVQDNTPSDKTIHRQLCKVAADGKLTKKFSIADLKDICDSLDIETEDFKRCKAPYKDVLTNVLSSCTCNKK